MVFWYDGFPFIQYLATVTSFMLAVGLLLGLLKRARIVPLCSISIAMLLFVSDLIVADIWCTLYPDYYPLTGGYACSLVDTVSVFAVSFLSSMGLALIVGWWRDTASDTEVQEPPAQS